RGHAPRRRRPCRRGCDDRRRHHGRRDPALPGPRRDRPARGPGHARGTAGRLARPLAPRGEAGGLRRRHAMVNFSPSEEQELLRQTLADFAREALRPHLRESDEKNAMPPELPAKAWELGLVQESIPESLGGFGGTRSALSGTLMLEELAYGGLALALHLVSPRLLTVPLLVAGTDAQRAQWLPKFAGAKFTSGTAAVVEPRWDFDIGRPATRAERNGGDWALSGTKCFVPLADRAEGILVYATTPEGLAAFLVGRNAKGLSVGEREKNMGVKALETFPVTLESVRVPAAARLGGDGADLQPLLDASRVASAAAAVGVARAAFDYAREYAKERKAFGVAIAQK